MAEDWILVHVPEWKKIIRNSEIFRVCCFFLKQLVLHNLLQTYDVKEWSSSQGTTTESCVLLSFWCLIHFTKLTNHPVHMANFLANCCSVIHLADMEQNELCCWYWAGNVQKVFKLFFLEASACCGQMMPWEREQWTKTETHYRSKESFNW